MRFAFIDVEKTSYPMRILCRVLEVSRSGYYAWRARKPSARNLEDERLRPKIIEAFKIGRGTYGSPRVRVELVDQGFEIGRKRVARLMRELGLQGISPRKFRVTTNSDHDHPIAENVLNRDFAASGTEREVGNRHHLHLHRRGLALLGGGDGSLFASDRGLVDSRSSEDRALSRCASDGTRSQDGCRRADPSFGSRGSVRE